MGFFKKIKDFFTCADITRDAVRRSAEEEERILSMKAGEALRLSDDMLLDAVLLRCFRKAERGGSDALSEAERAVYIAADYENDLNAGGIGHYLLNASESSAAALTASLQELGAAKHGTLWTGFVRDNNMDLSDLSEFRAETEEEAEALNGKYHFDGFNDMLFEIDVQDTVHFLAPEYIRKNISCFFDE